MGDTEVCVLEEKDFDEGTAVKRADEGALNEATTVGVCEEGDDEGERDEEGLDDGASVEGADEGVLIKDTFDDEDRDDGYEAVLASE